MNKYEAVLAFLSEVNYEFPVPISTKIDLSELAAKFCQYGTLCCTYYGNRVVAMVAGYTQNTPDDLGYISLVAVSKNARRKGLASVLIHEFLVKAATLGLRGVHVYTHQANAKAIDMYHKIGFTAYKPENESRPEDIHLIYLF